MGDGQRLWICRIEGIGLLSIMCRRLQTRNRFQDWRVECSILWPFRFHYYSILMSFSPSIYLPLKITAFHRSFFSSCYRIKFVQDSKPNICERENHGYSERRPPIPYWLSYLGQMSFLARVLQLDYSISIEEHGISSGTKTRMPSSPSSLIFVYN